MDTSELVGQTAENFKAYIKVITPALAEEWLARTQEPRPNRNKERIILSYARDIQAGAWKDNGVPIILSESGRLLDGRSRLRACILANRPFRTLVVENIAEATFETIDDVRKRTLSDILHMREQPHGRAIASALMVIWRFRRRDLENQAGLPSFQELLAILDQHPGIVTHSLDAALQISIDGPWRRDSSPSSVFARFPGTRR